jgi:hypothetical protein
MVQLIGGDGLKDVTPLSRASTAPTWPFRDSRATTGVLEVHCFTPVPPTGRMPR